MEAVGGRRESPTETFSRSTRRVRSNNKTNVKLTESKDQENVNNTSLEQNISTTIKDEVTKVVATINSNSSTPRRKKDPLANLHSNLSPKYIGFTTPPNQLNSSKEERTRSLRKRRNNSNNISDTPEDKDKELELTFTPNNEGTVGFVRRTPRNRDPQITPDNSTKRKKFVSPIDKLLIKNGAVMEYNNNLPLLDDDEMQLKDKEEIVNIENNKLNEVELGVKELEVNDESSKYKENACRSFENFDNVNEKGEDNDSISTEIAKQMEDVDDDDDDADDADDKVEKGEESNTLNIENIDCNVQSNTEIKYEYSIDNSDLSLRDDIENVEEIVPKEEEFQMCEHEENVDKEKQNQQEEKVKNSSEKDEECSDNILNETVSKTDEPENMVKNNVEVKKMQNLANEQTSSDKTVTVDDSNAKQEKVDDENEIEIVNKEYFEEIKQNKEVLVKVELESSEQNKNSLVKIELESMECESNNEFSVDASIPANSPSAVSMDSAKGSSIVNEVTWMSFSTGDLYWGQIYNYCYWPCMVCPDPEGKTITTEEVGRSGDQTVLVHVRFFADNGRRNWVKRENLMPYNGVANYQERVVEVREKYGPKHPKYKLYVPTKRKEQVWFEAVNEANILVEVPYANRLEKFYEVYEKSKAFHKLEKQRRKSMYMPVNSGTGSDIESFYDSNDNINSLSAAIKNKRERSISPYSPAYSPIKDVTAKRRKLSGELELASTSSSSGAPVATKPEDNSANTNLNLSQANSVASTSSNPRSLSDLDIFNSLEFRKFYAVMKDFVMERNHNLKLEKSLVVAVRNIWALKQLNRQQMEHQLQESLTDSDLSPALALINARSTGEVSVKRLSSRLKTLMVRKSLMSQQAHESTPERSVTPKPAKVVPDVEKVKKPINRPILEVIDDIFDLDTKYLFKGMCRDPVCKYCLKPGENLRRCSKNCTYWLHKDCLYKNLNKNVRRSNKSLTEPKSINTLNGSQSSSLISLTEVGTASHVTGDSENSKADVICRECANNEPAKCMVCHCTESKKGYDSLIKCSMAQCERAFHPACCKYWPQAKITISKNLIESFRCPSHVCHTCVSDDPKGKFQHLSNAKLTKCVKCPASFHTDSTCIPAGSQILTAAHIICPRHSGAKHDMMVNVNWCFICVGGGQLTCCETCPTAVHAHCLKIPIAANEGYICEECESGRMPLYGEMVWAKFNNFRWWPAIILPPTEIPRNIARKTHNPSDFVVRFFGTHDHGWISRRRVYLYLEGDSSEPPKSKSSLDLSYNKGVEEAKEVYEIIKAKKLQQRNSNESKEKLHPQPYVRIKANRAVPPVKLHVDIESVSKCECDPREENPCGPDTNCLNRVLYHECNPKLCPAGERCQNQMFESRVSPRLDVVYMKEKGFGLVCREPIKAGSFVIEYVGEVINDDEFQARMQQKSQDRDENFYFLSVEKDYIIDAGPKGNLARFMNHSCDPNCETQKWAVNSLNRVGLFAIRDIPENTELTFNYHWDDLLGNEKKTCYCGAKNCAGQIGAKIKDLDTVKEPTAVSVTVKNKSRRKTKPNKKLLNSGLKNKFVSKLKAKTKSRTKKTARPEGTSNKVTTVTESVTKEPTENDEASTSRLLESPDIFS